jgi:hypothetical protein
LLVLSGNALTRGSRNAFRFRVIGYGSHGWLCRGDGLIYEDVVMLEVSVLYNEDLSLFMTDKPITRLTDLTALLLAHNLEVKLLGMLASLDDGLTLEFVILH